MIMKNINSQTNICNKKDANYFNSATWISFTFAIGKLIIVLARINGVRTYAPEVMCFDICQTITLIVCAILIGFIAYNIKRNRVFVKANANLIKAIGFVVGVSGSLTFLAIFHFTDSKTFYLRDYMTSHYSSAVIGTFIIAIGYMFQIAIRIKEEQDLTI